jgi:hypothetical protein
MPFAAQRVPAPLWSSLDGYHHRKGPPQAPWKKVIFKESDFP